MDFNDFETISFPQDPDIVYALGIECKGKFVPFYVGQTSRNIGRFGGYVSAKFSASTDFKVGEAVKCFFKKGYNVLIKFKKTKNKEIEEKNLLARLRGTIPLLNDFKGYDYKNADEKVEKQKIQQFIDEFLNDLENICPTKN